MMVTPFQLIGVSFAYESYRKVLPMSPEYFVTYVSVRSCIFMASLKWLLCLFWASFRRVLIQWLHIFIKVLMETPGQLMIIDPLYGIGEVSGVICVPR